MEEEIPKRRYRLILDFKCQFPEKLFDVANDGALIKWNRNDSVSVTSEEEFENNVMKWYPGFLQIPSFQNFKRLFREYGFDRVVNQNNNYEWSHPCFVRGRRELLTEIKTRRKSFRTPQFKDLDDSLTLSFDSDDDRRFPRRRRARTRRFGSSNQVTPMKSDLGGGGDVISSGAEQNHTYVVKAPFQDFGKQIPIENYKVPQKVQENNLDHNAVKRDLTQIMDTYAVNELTEAEYNEWLAKQRKLDVVKSEPAVIEINNDVSAREFWWMYKDGGNNLANVNNNLTQNETSQVERATETVTPCGFCKCCSAISNYVHVFGEVPENIQVIDLLEEVVETVDA